MDKVLLTGATGYIGHNLTARLAATGWQVHILVRPESDARRANTATARHIYDGGTESVLAAVAAAKPDVVFHLAGLVKRAHAVQDVEAIVGANVLLGAQVLEAMAATSCRILVNAGTYWEYDTEGHYAPNSLYAATKRAFQDLIVFYVRFHRLRAITLILFDVYGPSDWRGKLIPSLVAKVRAGKPMPATGGEQRVDLVYIDDVTDGFMRAAALLREEGANASGHRVFALDTGRRLKVKEVAAVLETVAGRHLDVRWGELPYRDNQIFEPKLATEILPGWSPKVPLEEGLRRVLATTPETRGLERLAES